MRLFFLVAMRHAPVILFAIGLFDMIVVLVAGIPTYLQLRATSAYDAPYVGMLLPSLAQVVSPALKSLVWPWLGAAALWRFDGVFLGRYKASKEPGA